ncbi:hypothetical protein [Streptomyces sp. NPDC018031]|uniref:hypothetical protein n=1 Tax=Streptomyces sp. NPDC018031 TaxID=3365033 RepID=UPI00378CBD28
MPASMVLMGEGWASESAESLSIRASARPTVSVWPDAFGIAVARTRPVEPAVIRQSMVTVLTERGSMPSMLTMYRPRWSVLGVACLPSTLIDVGFSVRGISTAGLAFFVAEGRWPVTVQVQGDGRGL